MFALVVAAGASAVTWWATRTSAARAAAGEGPGAAGRELHPLERDSTIVLDLSAEAAEDERAQRLIRTAVAQVFAQESRVQHVTVTNRDGAVLARIPRTAPPLRDVPEVRVPREESRGHTPSPVGHAEPPPLPEIDPDGLELEPAHRQLAEVLDLPERVVAHVTDPEDPADIVQAILTASGATVERDDDVIRSDGHVFVVIDGHGRAILGDALSRAYLHFERTRAKRGYVVLLGFVDPAELSRRQALAPQLTYVGRDAIQRMADAVAIGADPLAFVTPPKVEVVRG